MRSSIFSFFFLFAFCLLSTHALPQAKDAPLTLSMDAINDRWAKLDNHVKAFYASSLSVEGSAALLSTLNSENQQNMLDIVRMFGNLSQKEQEDYLQIGRAKYLEESTAKA